jgi:hypothetical protein
VHVPPRRAAPALVALLTLLTGCAGNGGSVPASAGGEASTSSSTPAASPSASEPAAGTAAPEFPSGTEAATASASADARLTVSTVRLAAQDGFDRVVFELGGVGTPGWDVRYVDQPTAEGSGAPVEVAGEAVLQVGITGAGYPYDTGVEEYAATGPLTAAGTAGVTEVVFAATYEGVTTAFIGSRGTRPFRVYALEDPARVVVEVAHTG